MFYYLTFGLVLGLTAGLSPGPLLTLVISETLQHGISAGIKVALAPVITDTPIVIIMLVLATHLSDIVTILGIISLIGACYILFIAFESMRIKSGQENGSKSVKQKSITKGVITNALSPHPYLFWLSIGSPTIAKSMNIGIIAPVLFICGFYLSLIGAKIMLAVLVGKSRNLMSGVFYRYTMKFLALTLIIFSIILFSDGLTLLGI